MTTDWILRPLQPEDFSRGLLETLESLAPVGLTPQEAEGIWHERLTAGNHTYVVEEHGEVVGTASIIIERKFIRNGGLVGHIEDVAVRADRQRLGIGTRLVEHLTAEAFRMGCYKVILNALSHVTGFYARLGYKVHDSGLRVNKMDWEASVAPRRSEMVSG